VKSCLEREAGSLARGQRECWQCRVWHICCRLSIDGHVFWLVVEVRLDREAGSFSRGQRECWRCRVWHFCRRLSIDGCIFWLVVEVRLEREAGSLFRGDASAGGAVGGTSGVVSPLTVVLSSLYCNVAVAIDVHCTFRCTTAPVTFSQWHPVSSRRAVVTGRTASSCMM
jgi:hypothetical protein